MKIQNETGFETGVTVIADEAGRDLVVFVAKASFDIGGFGKLTLADAPKPVLFADEWYAEPAKSSIRYAADTLPYVFGTEIVLHGFAYPEKQGDTTGYVGVQVGAFRKVIQVFGQRHWIHSVAATFISAPQPYYKIPIQYEYAYGGLDETHPNPKNHAIEPRNPVGMSFFAKDTQKVLHQSLVPFFETPNQWLKSPDARPQPAGFGFIGAHWQPRQSFGGTYDKKWQETRQPLLPSDFDRRFFHAVPLDQITPKPLLGGEPIVVLGASPEYMWRFNMPRYAPKASIIFKKRPAENLALSLGRILIDADKRQLILSWYASATIQDLFQIRHFNFTL